MNADETRARLSEAVDVLDHAIVAIRTALAEQGHDDPYKVVDHNGQPILAPLLAAYVNGMAALARS